MISNISRAIFSVPRKMTFAPAFKSSEPEKQDTVEFSTKNLGLGVSDEEKIKILDEILDKKLKNFSACIRYYRGESEDIAEITEAKLDSVMSDDGMSSDFYKDALKAMDEAATPEKAIFIGRRAIEKSEALIQKYWFDKGLEKKIDGGKEIAEKAVIEITSNLAQIQKCYERSLKLDDVPERLKVGRKKVSMIENYFNKMNEENKKIRPVQNTGVDILRMYGDRLFNLKNKFKEFLNVTPIYRTEIENKLSNLGYDYNTDSFSD